MQVTAIVGSLNPDDKLVATVHSLQEVGFTDILLVDDGSDEAHKAPFATLEQEGVTVLRHPVNAGKGRAMKTAFAYVLEQRPDSLGVITVDGDGQHGAADVRRLAEAMVQERCIWLGARDFTAPQVPGRSRFGNKASCLTMRLLCGMRVGDTQTGLRAVPRDCLPWLLEVPGDRYEFETNMLLEMQQRRTPFKELTIDTIYIDDNATSHFRPLVDGWRIYRRMLAHFFRFMASGLISAVLDVALFTLLVTTVLSGDSADATVWWATVIARVVSSLVNFTLNRRVVFRSKAGLAGTLVRYYALCLCQMLASALLVSLLNNLLPGWEPLLKCVVDICLFFVSFRLQQSHVFGRK